MVFKIHKVANISKDAAKTLEGTNANGNQKDNNIYRV